MQKDHSSSANLLPKEALPKKMLSSSDLAPAAGGPLKAPFNRKSLGVVGLRKWVKFDKTGETSIIQADKHALTHQLGVQASTVILITEEWRKHLRVAVKFVWLTSRLMSP